MQKKIDKKLLLLGMLIMALSSGSASAMDEVVVEDESQKPGRTCHVETLQDLTPCDQTAKLQIPEGLYSLIAQGVWLKKETERTERAQKLAPFAFGLKGLLAVATTGATAWSYLSGKSDRTTAKLGLAALGSIVWAGKSLGFQNRSGSYFEQRQKRGKKIEALTKRRSEKMPEITQAIEGIDSEKHQYPHLDIYKTRILICNDLIKKVLPLENENLRRLLKTQQDKDQQRVVAREIVGRETIPEESHYAELTRRLKDTEATFYKKAMLYIEEQNKTAQENLCRTIQNFNEQPNEQDDSLDLLDDESESPEDVSPDGQCSRGEENLIVED